MNSPSLEELSVLLNTDTSHISPMVSGLHYLDAKDIMTLAHMQEQIKMKAKKEILAQHKYPIWQGKNDKQWYTYLPDETKKRPSQEG